MLRLRLRLRLSVVLIAAFALVTALAFVLAALVAGSAVEAALAGRVDVPSVEAAGRAARRSVWLWGGLLLAISLPAGLLLARLIVAPLRGVRRAVQRLDEPRAPEAPFLITEIHDLTRGVTRAAAELRDLLDREAHERHQLSALLAAVSEGILQLQGNGRIARVNPAAREILKLPADIEGHAVSTAVRHPELRGLFRRAAAGEAVVPKDITLDDRRLLITASPLEAGGAVVTVVDLTDLRRLEQVRRDFIANASHELKTPLTSIRGYAETLLSDDLPDAERRLFLETVARNAERLQNIVDDLLDLSRLESGRWQPALEDVDLAAMARECWALAARGHDKEDVRFVIESVTDDVAHADRRALEQIFSNLYDNALRHTPAGRITVRVDAYSGDAPTDAGPGTGIAGDRATPDGARSGRWIELTVSDTGTGIPSDSLPRIFERFYRLDPARSRAEGGTGLGLAIVKHLVESMGGSISAESRLGRGTTIRILLPAARPGAGPGAEEEPAGEQVGADPTPRAPGP